MSETKHTPGQWRVVGDYEAGFFIERDIDDADECPAICCLQCDDALMPETVKADAYLIAAAPDAYQLLKEINDYLNPTEDARQINSVNTSSILHRKIQEWIARANGGAQ